LYKSKSSSEGGILQDAERIFTHLTQELHIPSEKIIVSGRSIGSGPAVHVAAGKQVAALILISPFTSLREAAASLVGSMAKLFVKDRFHNLEKISKVTSPALIIHGKADEIVPYTHSEQLYGSLLP